MDELHDYLQAPADGNWLAKLAQAVAHQPPPETRWEAAQTATEQLLERWIIGLGRFGREPLVRVAVAAAQPTLAIWAGDAAWRPPVVDEIVQAVAGGTIEPPQLQIAAAQAWLQTPDEAHQVAADATLGEFANRQQELWEPEFEYLWGEASLWAIQAAEACVVTVTHPQPAPWAARAVVATLKAVQLGYVDQAVEPLRRVCQWGATGAFR